MAKILVVEDELEIRSAIVEELTEEGHVTIEAGNGLEGLEKVVAEMPDLVLSDITMPQMNGYQFFRAFREKYPAYTDLPFIFLTALADREDELKGLRLGVDDYLIKPIDFDLLHARIEIGLRRRQPLADQAQPLALSHQNPNPDAEAEAEAAKVCDIAAKNSGRILTGKFETISLEDVKERIGDRWPEMSDRILTNARAAIQDHLGSKDVCHITTSENFVVCFADLTDEQVDAKVRQIGDAIRDRLFTSTDNEDLSQVDAQAYKIFLEPDDKRGADALFTDIESLIDKEKMAASHANKRSLKQIYEYEDLFALKLLNSKGVPSKIKMLSFDERHANRIRQLFEARHYGSEFLLDLQQLLFERLKGKQSLSRAFSDAVMLLPIHFIMIEDQKARSRLIDLCEDLQATLDGELMIEIIETPHRIMMHKDVFRPLPVGRKIQFLEIRRTAQLDGIEAGDLQELGVASASMRYENVMQHDEQSLARFMKLLKEAGAKFCIKDIPQGKMLDAQSKNAHLYALKR